MNKTMNIEDYKQGVRDAIQIMSIHPDGEGKWCDTGEDMEWACRDKCVELGVKRVELLILDYLRGKETNA
jgi:hypothetical protein